MRLLSQCLLAVMIGTPVASALAAGADQSCRGKAISALHAASPDGFAIFERTTRSGFFRSWIDCGASQYDLPTAVHESTHFIASETDAFPLVGGGSVERPHEVSAFFPPYRIADRFGADDYTTIYLRRGKASSSTDVLYLLDEFNAYTHDLSAAVDLKALSTADIAVDHRDGLAAMMAFLAAYAEKARTSEPVTWNGLRQPKVAATVATLWKRAELVMARSCGIPDFGTSDRSYLGQVCANGARSGIGQLIGRAPACPTACLKPTSELEQISADDEETSSSRQASVTTESDGDDGTESDRRRHPFAGNAGPRRHRLQTADE